MKVVTKAVWQTESGKLFDTAALAAQEELQEKLEKFIEGEYGSSEEEREFFVKVIMRSLPQIVSIIEQYHLDALSDNTRGE